MSRHIAIIAAIGICILTGFLSYRTENRAPASFKHAHLHEQIKHKVRMTKKLMSPFEITFTSSDQEKLQVGDSVEVTANIVSHKNVNSVNYEWRLPPQIEVISGSINGGFDFVEQRKPYEVTLQLRVIEIPNEPLHFVVSTDAGPQQVTNSEQFHILNHRERKQALEDNSKRMIEYNESLGAGHKVYR